MRRKLPIEHWSHSSLLAYLRNPLAWYIRYVEKVYDTPRTPASIVGTAGHVALEYFYKGASKEVATEQGLLYIRSIPDFEISFGKAKTKKEKLAKRASMEREYLQAISFYLVRPPRYIVRGVEVRHTAHVPGLPLPVKAVSDLVVASRARPGHLDIIDHKFVDSFASKGEEKPIHLLQAIFNYYTVRELFDMPIHRFVVIECKKTRNADGSSQLRKYVFEYDDLSDSFTLFHHLLKDATEELRQRKVFLPNPSDMFEGMHSFELYRLGLMDGETDTQAR